MSNSITIKNLTLAFPYGNMFPNFSIICDKEQDPNDSFNLVDIANGNCFLVKTNNRWGYITNRHVFAELHGTHLWYMYRVEMDLNGIFNFVKIDKRHILEPIYIPEMDAVFLPVDFDCSKFFPFEIMECDSNIVVNQSYKSICIAGMKSKTLEFGKQSCDIPHYYPTLRGNNRSTTPQNCSKLTLSYDCPHRKGMSGSPIFYKTKHKNITKIIGMHTTTDSVLSIDTNNIQNYNDSCVGSFFHKGSTRGI